MPAGCPGRLAAGCPLAIANLAGHGYLSVALVACFLGLVGLPAGLVGLPAALLSLICLLAGFGRVLFFRGGAVFLAGLLIGVGDIFLQAGV